MLARLVLIAALCIGSPSAEEQSEAQTRTPMKCETGPVNRTFGGAAWIVYSCADEVSMVAVSAPGNVASPFYFFSNRKQENMRAKVAGTGARRKPPKMNYLT